MDSWDQVQVLMIRWKAPYQPRYLPRLELFFNFIIIYFYSMFDLFICFLYLSTQSHVKNAKVIKRLQVKKGLQSLGLEELCFY